MRNGYGLTSFDLFGRTGGENDFHLLSLWRNK